MGEKRPADNCLSSEPKRQQLYNYGDILFSILEKLHTIFPNLIQFFQCFGNVNRAFRRLLSTLSTKTLQQKKILETLLASHHLHNDPFLHAQEIQPRHRLATGPGTGKTRLMLEACATILQEKGQSVMIICSESFLPMYRSLLSYIEKSKGWKRATPLLWFEKGRHVSTETEAIVCLSMKSYSLPLAKHFWSNDIEHIFSDDYTGKYYPKIVSSLRSYVYLRNRDRPFNYLAITASQSDAELHTQNDVQLALPPTTVDFHVVTHCSLCPDFCDKDDDTSDDGFSPEWTRDRIPFPFNKFLKEICEGEPKVVLFMQFSRMSDRQKTCITSLIDWAREHDYVGKTFWTLQSTPKRLGEQIAEFNAIQRGLIVFDTHRSITRGHSIYGSALVFINTVSIHGTDHCAREFKLFEQPPWRPTELLQMIGRIRRPDTPFKKLRIDIYDAAVSLVIPLVLSASGKYTVDNMKDIRKKFAQKNKVDSYSSLLDPTAREIANRINDEIHTLDKKMKAHETRAAKAFHQPWEPPPKEWISRMRSLSNTKQFVQRIGFPEHLCTKVPNCLRECFGVGPIPFFEQLDLTHFRIHFS